MSAKYTLKFSENALADLAYQRKIGGVKLMKKILTIIKELEEHPETGIGKPERLRHQLSGKWSRRINLKDRLIYRIDEENKTVEILATRDHYK